MKIAKLFLKWIVIPALFGLLGYYVVAPRVYDNSGPAPSAPSKPDTTLDKVEKQLREDQASDAAKPSAAEKPDVQVGDAKTDKEDDFNRNR